MLDSRNTATSVRHSTPNPTVRALWSLANALEDTLKTAQNTWGVLKKKLKDAMPEVFEATDIGKSLHHNSCNAHD